MSKYRISVTDEEKNFWIVVDKGIIIKNPTKNDLSGTKIVSYTKTNICHICRQEKEMFKKELTEQSILYPGNACHIKNQVVCHRHWGRMIPKIGFVLGIITLILKNMTQIVIIIQ